MDPTQLYTGKADKYRRSRWDYANQAIEAIFTQTRFDETAIVADVGAGTGILGRVGIIYLVEPNQDMRRTLIENFSAIPACPVIAGRAEATTLADRSIDLIAVGQAIHWFEPQPARVEFKRILKPGGWLAVLRNRPTNERLNEALAKLFQEISLSISLKINYPEKKPISYYFEGRKHQKISFNFTLAEARPQFIDSLASAADAPEESDPVYPRFEHLAGEIFKHFSQDGMLILKGVTELYLGKLA